MMMLASLSIIYLFIYLSLSIWAILFIYRDNSFSYEISPFCMSIKCSL